MNIQLPDYVNEIIQRLSDCGYEAYAVGGCVRDALLGLVPSDYDITTSATPDEVKAAFADIDCAIHDTGLKHGTVTVVINGVPCEVTTFRTDGEYSDNRRPDSVTFTRNLIDDLARRDFTVNAMAYSPVNGISDFFNGRDDLANKVIRTVGVAEERFNEDGLRILRALRFACLYDFSIETKTAEAIHKLKHLLANVSGERIAQELNKLILGKVSNIIYEYADVFTEIIAEIADCRGFDQRSVYHDRDVLTHSLNAVDNAPRDKVTRLALLFHDTGKPSTFRLTERREGFSGSFKGHPMISYKITRRVMKALKYDNDTRYKVQTLVRFHDVKLKTDKPAVKRLLNRFGTEQFFRLIDVHIADYSAKAPGRREDIKRFEQVRAVAESIISNNECYCLRQLAVNGVDLVELGYKGRQVGEKLNVLLQAVIGEKCGNTHDELLQYLQN